MFEAEDEDDETIVSLLKEDSVWEAEEDNIMMCLYIDLSIYLFYILYVYRANIHTPWLKY